MAARLPRIRVIAGPTAVGKTSYSLQLAKETPTEIVSADSRQIYRQLTIGTAKPDKSTLSRIPHHFIDELDVGEPYSAGQFASQANERITSILERGREPIVVGGATLYLHALIHGLSTDMPADSKIRAGLEAELANEGREGLYKRLTEVDPVAAGTMDPSKTTRVMRALEVYQLTGNRQSDYHTTTAPPAFQFDVTVLTMARPVLYDRINSRVDFMLTVGLVDETKSILDKYGNPQTPLLQTIGYQEAVSYLAGDISHAEMSRLIKRNSRRYAKRQLTWFKRYPEYQWLDLTDSDH